MGLAKESVFLNISDPEFSPKFAHVFGEHIDGWAGNAYKKAIKKTEQSQMLWKQVGVMSVAVMSTLRKRVPHLHTMG
eukprot:7781349-Pyramimonas_sp.AAC.1